MNDLHKFVALGKAIQDDMDALGVGKKPDTHKENNMKHLNDAISALNQAEGDQNFAGVSAYAAVALAYAAIAQAEQLGRIADALERCVQSYHDGKLNYFLTGKAE